MTDNTTPESAAKNTKPSKTKPANTTSPKADKAELESSAKLSSPAKKAANKTASTAPKTPPAKPPKQGISKVGALALVLSVGAIAGLGGGYFWLMEQHKTLRAEVQQSHQLQLSATEQNLQQALNQQQATLTRQQETALAQVPQLAEQALSPALSPVQTELAQLRTLTQSLQQNNSAPWQVKEAEYLIRVASRSLWLEQDAQLAIRLLNEADDKLKTTKNPEYLPVRKLISQDIAALNLLPELATDDVILTLMGLTEQIDALPIAMAHLPTPTTAAPDLTLSEDIADWRENLSKTWQKIASYFFTVKRRASNVEALLSPEQQNHLRQNLQLKLQLAQWATSQHKKALYQESLNKVNAWVSEYFDMESLAVTNFQQTITELRNQVVSLSLPNKLESYRAISRLAQNPAATPLAPVDIAPKPSADAEAADDNEQKINGATL
ncbi:hypothetical protein DXX93_20360 [Thalassotalea euphylliae]|uniref:Heme biosynthesis operon protein HemX n=1 Tax=Thalassotalea euphylliae TaxID=1655234 RepID=A0A3E0TVI8_9GAMM|nr:uroporphyrinogen-III C-methyltransferase [Thalassotalea euphylliae]REL28686.1 hypothetical protein DXX93_20360 [Thalassotalea euphylliae]